MPQQPTKQPYSFESSRWTRVAGPLVMIAAIIITEVAHRAGWPDLMPAPLLLTVLAFATLFGGLVPGAVSAILSILYYVDFYSVDRQFGVLTRPGTIRVLGLSLISVLMLLMADVLGRWLKTREHLRAEARLQAGEERFKLILSQSGTTVFRQDCDLKYLWAYNPPQGLSEEDLVGRTDSDLFGAEAARELTRVKRQVLETGERIRQEHALIMAGEEHYLDMILQPVREDSGEIIGLLGAAGDVTERRRAEQALAREHDLLEEERRRLQAVLDVLPVAVFILDANGKVLHTNPAAAEVWGGQPPHPERPGEYGVYKGWWVASGEPVAPLDWNIARAVLRGEQSVAEEIEIETFEHRRKTVLSSARPIRDDAGNVVGAVGIDVDITALQTAIKQLKTLNDTLEQRVAERTAVAERRAYQLRRLAADLTHAEQRERHRLAIILHDNLQQLLAAARMWTGVLRDQVDREDAKETISQVTGLLVQAIEASRSLTVELSPPALYEKGLAPALEWLAHWMKEKHDLEVDCSADAAAEPASEEVRVFLFQAARELLFNVAKHAGVDEARLVMQRDGEQVKVEVIDSGAGFEASRLEPARAAAGAYGIFSIRERAEVFGGRLVVDTAPGRGTHMTLYAPAAEVAVPAQRPSAPGRPAAAYRAVAPVTPQGTETAGRIRVLLADDHEILRQGIADLLEREPDIEVVAETADGQETVELAREVRPDVVVMDVNMPRLSGVEATRRILAEHPGVSIIGLSMYDEEAMGSSMQEAGAVTYLNKAGPAESLIAAIRASAIAHKSRGPGD